MMMKVGYKKGTGLVLAAAVVLAAAAGSAQAADTATATASAELVTPITVSKTADLDFGRLSSGAAGGTSVVSAAGARSVTGDVVEEGGTVSAASFDVTGSTGLGYDITLPTSISITSGGDSMTVNAFTSDKAGNAGTLTGGTDSFSVGGTLTVAASQATGTYTGTFDVTVAYQ